MIKIVQGDITTLAVDAIVNAANQVMLGGGGVDGAIHDAAGDELYEACLKVPEVRPGVRCPTGEARITPGFKLSAKFVIHTVGPVYCDGKHGEPEKLAACYRNSLALAVENGCTSIAFPCISTGIYGYPKEEAAQIAVREVRRFLSPAESAENAEMEVVFCCFSERDKRIYEQVLENLKMNKEHELAVNEIPQILFSIPNYQRGYRWTEKEVEALLNDLLAFAKSDTREESYCLQPLVLQEMADGQLRVVDGQQRLTTLTIILQSLGMETHWDIKYTAEGDHKLKDLLKDPNLGGSINDYFRKRAMVKVQKWLDMDTSRTESLRSVLQGEGGKRIVFLRYDLPRIEDPNVDKDEGHGAFQRLNAGKTALTSSELIRALFMEAGNGLNDSDKADIAKEWDLIESAMTDESFWAIWNNSRFRDVPTRMDFLFSIVLNVEPEKARQDPLLVYRTFEESVSKSGVGLGNEVELRKMWKETLRCWWWMQSCHADMNVRHLIGWLSIFTDRQIRVMYREQWENAAGCRLTAFKALLRRLVADSIGDGEFDSFRYDSCDSGTLRKVFVLLNMLEAERRGACFRFDLYKNDSWDVEHIASQTDNPLEKKEDREEWLRLAETEMSETEKERLAQFATFEEKWQVVWKMFERSDDIISDKDAMGNLALLDSATNRSYKNAIFPAKRRRILLELPEEVRQGRKYVLPATEAAFSKTFSPFAAQMRCWGESDAKMYRQAMKDLFNGFMNSVEVI